MLKWSFVQLSLRASLAAVISLLVAERLGLRYPLYAFIAAVIVTDLKSATSRQLGMRRLGATVIGAFCGALLSDILPVGPWSIGAGILTAMLASQLLRAEDGARVAGYICGIILLDHSFEPWSYALHRFLETSIGILAAWAISYVPKLISAEANSGPAP